MMVLLQVRCQQEEKARWIRAARAQRITMAKWVRMKLSAGLPRNPDEIAPPRKKPGPRRTVPLGAPSLCERCARLGGGKPLRVCGNGCLEDWEAWEAVVMRPPEVNGTAELLWSDDDTLIPPLCDRCVRLGKGRPLPSCQECMATWREAGHGC
jgi:hypothetical protein